MDLDENNQVYLGGWYVKICNLLDHSQITILDIEFIHIHCENRKHPIFVMCSNIILWDLIIIVAPCRHL